MTRSPRIAKTLVAAVALLGGRSVPVRAEDAGIECWTDYAIYPLRCICTAPRTFSCHISATSTIAMSHRS